MPTFAIESNGRLEKSAVYYNGEQLAGVKEVVLNLSEDGTFDAIIQYTTSTGTIMNKQIFTDFLDGVQTREPAFSEEEAQQLQMLTVESDGDIEQSIVLMNNEPLDGIVNLLVRIKAPEKNEQAGSGFLSKVFGFGKKSIVSGGEFKAEATFRNEDGSVSTEMLF